MADSLVFDWTCEALEASSSLTRIEARGTVRIALKAAGLAAATVEGQQMRVVIDKILMGELSQRGIENAAGLCRDLMERLEAQDFAAPSGDTAEAVFARLGGGA